MFLQKVRDSLSSESPREDTITGNELYVAQKKEGLTPGSCQTGIEYVLSYIDIILLI